MAESTITGPDGNTYTITHPESASDADIFRYVQQQVATGNLQADEPAEQPEVQEEPSLIDRIPPIPGVGGIPVGASLEMAQNAPGSFGNVARETIGALLSPVETAQAGMELLQGGADWFGRQMIQDRTGQEYAPTEAEQSLIALDQYYGDRYGSPMAIEQTLREDPAGVLMDVPLPSGAMPARAAAINPVRGSARGVSRLLEPVADRAKRRDFESDIKYTPSTERGRRKQMTDTAMELDIDVSQRGLDRVQDEIRDLQRNVDARVSNVDADLDVFTPLSKLDEQRAKARSNMSSGVADLKAIDDVESELLGNLDMAGADTMTPAQMNRWKRDLYTDIDWSDSDKRAANQARKAVAKGAKESLEAVDPELAQLNQQWGRLIDLEEPLSRALNRIDNRHTQYWEWGGAIPLMLAGARTIERNANKLPRLIDNLAVGALSEAGWLDQALEEVDIEIPYRSALVD